MTDEICGHPTGDGGECKNPPTEGDHCWIYSHGGDVSGHGRPSLLEEYKDDLLEAAREGLTYEGIARVAGVGVSTLHEWRNEYEDFSESLERARGEAERELVQDVGAEFILERSYAYVKTEKREIDMNVDASHDVTADFVTYSSGGDDGDE
jgi:transposase-like protein